MLAISDLGFSSDILSFGIDSLHILHLIAFLVDAVEKKTGRNIRIPASWIYNNPTPQYLAEIVYTSIIGADISAFGESWRSQTSIPIEQWLEKYTHNLSKVIRAIPLNEASNCVILTGSTGSLGSYLLDRILQISSVSKVYCLNRSSGGKTKQRASFQARGLDFDAISSRELFFYQARYWQPKLGLPSQVYDELLSSVDTILTSVSVTTF